MFTLPTQGDTHALLTDRTEYCHRPWMHSPHTWPKPCTDPSDLHAAIAWRDCPGRMVPT